MGYAIAIYASNMLAALPLLTLKSNMDNCLEPYKSDTMSMLTPILSGVGLGLTKTYKLVCIPEYLPIVLAPQESESNDSKWQD